MDRDASTDGQSVETSAIGKCEILFCPDPASGKSVYSQPHGRELAVCEQCYQDRTSAGSSLEGSKKAQFGQLARELDDD